jgi:hypothetical protein
VITLQHQRHARADTIGPAAAIEPRSWRKAYDIPAGVVFRSDAAHAEVTWRREVSGCRALPPVGTGRVYPVALVDGAWNAYGDHFVEVLPAANVTTCGFPDPYRKSIARQSQ